MVMIDLVMGLLFEDAEVGVQLRGKKKTHKMSGKRDMYESRRRWEDAKGECNHNN